MIKFFRHIRNRLIKENRVAKYMIYAIGEIILVVVGILIAIQINNWNEQQKANSFEVKILTEIRANLQTDLTEIREDQDVMMRVKRGCQYVKNHLLTLDQVTDSLAVSSGALRATPHFRAITSAYELLQSRDVGIIKNDSLRNAISYQYDMLYPYYRTYEEERTRFHALHSEPKLLEYFSMKVDSVLETSAIGLLFDINMKDYKRLQKDEQFLKVLSAIEFENDVMRARAKRVEFSILELIGKISDELLQI